MHQNPRLQILKSFLQSFAKYESSNRITKTNFPTTLILIAMRKGLDSANSVQRKLSVEIMSLLNKTIGWTAIEHFCSELSIKNLQILEKEIPDVNSIINIRKNTTT